MARLRTEVGFWSAVGGLRLRDVVTVEGFAAVVLGGGLAVVLALLAPVSLRLDLGHVFVGVAAALVAIVFAGLALVVSLLSDSYLRLLRAGSDGLMAFFRPFTIAIGIQVATIICAVIYLALSSVVPKPVEPWIFGLTSVLFFASCLEIVVLTRSVLMHALLRSKLGEVAEIEAKRQQRDRSGKA